MTYTLHANPCSWARACRNPGAWQSIPTTLKPRHVHALSQNSTKLSQSFHLQWRVHDDFVSIMPPLLSVAALFLIQPQTHQTALPQKQLSPKMRSASRSSPRPKAVGAHAACFTLPTVPRTAQNSSPSWVFCIFNRLADLCCANNSSICSVLALVSAIPVAAFTLAMTCWHSNLHNFFSISSFVSFVSSLNCATKNPPSGQRLWQRTFTHFFCCTIMNSCTDVGTPAATSLMWAPQTLQAQGISISMPSMSCITFTCGFWSTWQNKCTESTVCTLSATWTCNWSCSFIRTLWQQAGTMPGVPKKTSDASALKAPATPSSVTCGLMSKTS